VTHGSFGSAIASLTTFFKVGGFAVGRRSACCVLAVEMPSVAPGGRQDG
jgi:hypothetical protein